MRFKDLEAYFIEFGKREKMRERIKPIAKKKWKEIKKSAFKRTILKIKKIAIIL